MALENEGIPTADFIQIVWDENTLKLWGGSDESMETEMHRGI